jgi:hypothetical protein
MDIPSLSLRAVPPKTVIELLNREFASRGLFQGMRLLFLVNL